MWSDLLTEKKAVGALVCANIFLWTMFVGVNDVKLSHLIFG